MRRYTYCYNCGNQGHLYKNCHYPIISLGIIAFICDNNSVKILMIRRKDSIGYTDFIRGKYKFQLDSLLTIINIMTIEEKKKILSYDFKKLWNELWIYNSNRFEKEYDRAYNKNSNLLTNGIIHNDKKITLKEIILLSNTNFIELEWGFPKGKRNKNEKDIDAAIREFKEETNINNNSYKLIKIKPLIEDYIGSDNKKYRHIYYLAQLEPKTNISIDNNNYFQKTEISKIELLNINKAISLIRPYNKERIGIIKSVNNIIIHLDKLKINT